MQPRTRASSVGGLPSVSGRAGLRRVALLASLAAGLALTGPGVGLGASPDPSPTTPDLGTRRQARAWLEDQGLTVERTEAAGVTVLAGTTDGLEVRMILHGDRLVRSDLGYTTEALIHDKEVQGLIGAWRDAWAADASPYARWAFGLLLGRPGHVNVGHQVPLPDRTYGIDLNDTGDMYELEAEARGRLDLLWNREWVAVRPGGPGVGSATMGSDGCEDGAFPIDRVPGPLRIDYRVETTAPPAAGTVAWVIIAITPIIAMGPGMDIASEGVPLESRRVGDGAVAVRIPDGHSGPLAFSLDLELADSLDTHEARIISVPATPDAPADQALLDTVATAGFGWGRLLYMLCQPSAGPMPPLLEPFGAPWP